LEAPTRITARGWVVGSPVSAVRRGRTGKTFLYRLFGFGKIPKRVLPTLEREGIVLLDEGISGWVTFRNFRAPGRRYSRRRSWFTGSLVITGNRFAAFAFSRAIINVPLDDDHMSELRVSLDGEATLCVQFDPSAFHEDWSGSVKLQFSTPLARLFSERLVAHST
jgi:hypothetical protein